MKEIKCPKCGEIFSVDENFYDSIVKQIRDNEFLKELKNKELQFENEKKNLLQLTKFELEKEFSKELNAKDAKISQKDKEVLELKNKLESFNKDKELEIANIITDMSNKLSAQENFILKITNDSELAENKFKLREQALKEKYESQLRFKDEEIARYKDFKAKLSTKMLGESLEQHCEIAFEQLRATGFKTAYFEKDNDAKSGSKGDYIYRDYDNSGNELISIMFEMKNESDSNCKKKKNVDFLAELDKDRKEKNCEYAVLVSMLEPDNELYNNGIVDMSHHYEKMYVIRPQFFIPMITVLRNAAMNSLKYKHELELARTQNIDVSNFEAAMNDFKDKFANELLDLVVSGTGSSMLARRWQSALLVNVKNEILSKLLESEQAMDALSRIEGFRNLNKELTTLVNKSEALKKTKQEKKDKLTPSEKKELTEQEKEIKSKRKEIQEKLLKFATRIPVFMYLTDDREQTLKDVITQLEPDLFQRVTGLTIPDFELLVSIGIFNEQVMNSAVFAFKRYEDASLVYTGISKHEELNIGGWNTKISKEEFVNLS